MRTYELIAIGLLSVITLNCFSQQYGYRKDNILLPDRLIVSEHIPFDSIFNQQPNIGYLDSSARPIFEFVKEVDLPRILAEMALNGKIKVYDPEQIDFLNPINQSTPMPINTIKKNLGEETKIVFSIDSNGNENEREVTIEMDLRELTSFYFVDEWIFTADPLRFEKKTIVCLPVRRNNLDGSDYEGYFRYQKAFCFYNTPVETKVKSNVQLVAKYSYEYVLNGFQGFATGNFDMQMKTLISNDSYKSGFVTSSYTSPFFNTINQKIFIETLIKQAIEGKAKVSDYTTKKALTPIEVKNRVIVDQHIAVMDIEGNYRDTVIQRNLSDQIISIIFIEEWFFDKETLQILKKVVGIAPVQYYFDSLNGEYNMLKREVLFKIDTNN